MRTVYTTGQPLKNMSVIQGGDFLPKIGYTTIDISNVSRYMKVSLLINRIANFFPDRDIIVTYAKRRVQIQIEGLVYYHAVWTEDWVCETGGTLHNMIELHNPSYGEGLNPDGWSIMALWAYDSDDRWTKRIDNCGDNFSFYVGGGDASEFGIEGMAY